MTYEVRLAALNIAREIPHASAEELIATAQKIENHLLGTTAPMTLMETARSLGLAPASEEDKLAYNAMFNFKPEELTWTGTADDVKKLMLEGSTLLNASREIGLTTFLADFVAEQSRDHKQILWLSNTGREAEKARELILKRGGLVAVVDFGGLNRFADVDEHGNSNKTIALAKGTCRYDMIVVDGLASLPYGKETDFLASILPMTKHFIFASTPGQDRGLFHDMWTKSTDFQKVALMWNTPLRPQLEDTAKIMAKLRETIGEARFRNQFECGFRPFGEEPPAE